MRIDLPDSTATEAIGRALWPVLQSGGCVYLQGDLGAGKTTLVRALLQAAGWQGLVKSPTYTLVESYRVATGAIYHFDLYRLASPEELEYIGMRDYLEQSALCLIEWPENGRGMLPKADVGVRLEYAGAGRRLTLTSDNVSRLERLAAAVSGLDAAGKPG
ncbi:MAG: tRNA (adenosine(37)-N6)-threonylcarbamoyltransferase complex ATPase subunit type 1 TsaE [Methylococcales bacterium]|nr:tRNA (adenosine(37)-N6)-threonylcarbamoyltransferase complex ATPase subunit type 1 TsaE [Methylococcales bacterium]